MEDFSVSMRSNHWPFRSPDIQKRESLTSSSSETDDNASNTHAVGKKIIEEMTQPSSPYSLSSLTHFNDEPDFLEDGLDRKVETSNGEKNGFKKRKVTPLIIKDCPVSVSSSKSEEIESGMLVDDEWIYSGNIDKNGLPHGLGMVIVNDNSSYFGEFNEGKRTGKGVLICSKSTIYDGFVDDGLPDGVGIYKLVDGTWVEGNFKQGLPHGEATVTYPNEFTFTGIYNLGKLPKNGVIVFLSGEMDGQKYTGECLDMVPHGWGSLESTSNGLTSVLYGKFEYGKCQGQATLRRSDGLMRMGNCVDGLFVGKVQDKFPGQDSVEVFV